MEVKQSNSLHLVVKDQQDFIAQLPLADGQEDLIADAQFYQDFRDGVKEMIAQMLPQTNHGKRVFLSDYHPEVSVLVYYPQNNTAKAEYPCLYYIHGGGHISGFAAMYDYNFQKKADQLDVIVVAIDYRLSPENPYPSSLQDSFAGFEWIINNRETLKVNPEKISIMGESAGGCLTAALNLYIRDNYFDYKVKSQILIYPMLDYRTSYQKENLDNVYCGEYIWTHALNRIGWKSILGEHNLAEDMDTGYYSPALASDLQGLPETYISIGALDLFLSESLVYADRLVKAGVPLSLDVVAGATHLFDLIASETADQYNAQLTNKLRSLLY